MIRAIKILSFILLAQLALVGMVNANWHSAKVNHDNYLLGNNIQTGITEIVISDSENRLLLKKQGDHWIMPQINGLPVSSGKMATSIDNLAALKESWPVAQTASAAKRFEVAEDSYKKKISVKTGSDEYSLYLGTSPGLRKTHLRLEDKDAIYAASLSAHDFGVTVDDWLDKGLLQTRRADLTSLEFNELKLIKSEQGWKLEGLSEQEVMNEEALNKLLGFTDELTVSGLIDKENTSQFASGKPAFTLKAKTDTGTKEYAVYSRDADVAVKSSLRDEWFKLPKYQADKLINLTRDDLVTTRNGEPINTEG